MGAEADRERMATIARSLSGIESDQPASAEQIERAVAAADEFRRARGIPALLDDTDPPEEEFYRRARALGLRRRSR